MCDYSHYIASIGYPGCFLCIIQLRGIKARCSSAQKETPPTHYQKDEVFT